MLTIDWQTTNFQDISEVKKEKENNKYQAQSFLFCFGDSRCYNAQEARFSWNIINGDGGYFQKIKL